MTQNLKIKLTIISFLVASSLSKALSPLPIVQFDGLSQGIKRWNTVYLSPFGLDGAANTLHFDSVNSQASVIVYDPLATDRGNCYIYAVVNKTAYGIVGEGFTKQYCSLASITKIDRFGHVLFTTGEGEYTYVTDQKQLSILGKIKGNFKEALAQGVEFGMTKSTDGYRRDYFRIFSRASDVNGKYPENFYALVSNSTEDSFAKGSSNTLTLKKFDWVFKNTSNDVQFSDIDQVNFVSGQDGFYILEGQWITGKGTSTETSSSGPVCQYGAVNLRFFAGGPSGQYPEMYGFGGLDFACSLTPTLKTYQGVIAYSGDLNYFYAISPEEDKIQICNGLPKKYEGIKSIQNFTKGCKTGYKVGLGLNFQEYYSGVSVFGKGETELTIVNIKNKLDSDFNRQVIVFLAQGELPTFDTDTYFYTVSENAIWRIKRRFKKDDPLIVSYYEPVGDQGEKKIE